MANVTFSYAWTSDKNIIADWLKDDYLITSSDGKLSIPFFTTLEVEGFDDDGICEIYYDFIDWRDIDETADAPKPFTRENIITAMKNWGLLEELGLQEYADNESLIDMLVKLVQDNYVAEDAK